MAASVKNNLPYSYGIIMLAAGASSRLGKPKQLLPYKGETLLQQGLQIAIATGILPIVVVLGANAELVQKSIEHKDICIVINKAWSEGMAASIRCGMEELLKIAPQLDGVIIMVCDQPFVSPTLLADLVEKHRLSGKPIIASSYKGSIGTPALFDTTIFALLQSLKGDVGAKKIMQANPDWVEEVDFPLGEIDIDTTGDYELLLKGAQL